MSFVVDNSVVVGWYVASQADSFSEDLLDKAITEDVHVPSVWRAEFASVLLAFTHNRRLRPAQVTSIIEQIEVLEMIVDPAPPSVRKLVELGRRHALGAYDTCYLELAMRLHLPLATRDDALRKAGRRAGVAVI